ncbi:major facilitator superfamily MFS_1 [Gloeothece citriformis PCC 7424]|uniref:Major facilitator superfamily MFS_1 n=1 Tax=Gloeothece citriformis (strain PCC 7424) TaxID=65393 RepID=B7K9X0_GLOC7|nr:OFA family MFS transporter [Gloeothece citriformis]ACK71326.1 major facilitator superfamily MFS_1 [Gloeothece citriformis PCC 7424]
MDSLKLFGLPGRLGRWLIIVLGMTAMLCLGTVYSWSIFRKPLESWLNIGATASLLPYTIFLVIYAILMPITGFFIDKFGPRKVIAVGGVVMGLGYFLSSFTSNIYQLVLTYGMIAGAGVGIVYGVPLVVSAKWFPDKKGFALGLTVVGFGLSPLITAPLIKFLIKQYDIQLTFRILGIVFLVILVSIAMFLKSPPPNWQPISTSTLNGNTPSYQVKSVKEMLQTQTFYGLWLCYIIGAFVGLSAIGISSSVAQEIIKLDETTAAISVSLFAVFNGAGRILFGWLTDRLKPKGAAIITFTLILFASIVMINAQSGDTLSYLVAFCVFWLCLGGWLAIAPTATLTFFQAQNYAKNYGIVFTAYGLGALGGSLIAGSIRDIFGSYTYAFYPMGGLAIVGMFIAVFLLKPSFSPVKTKAI